MSNFSNSKNLDKEDLSSLNKLCISEKLSLFLLPTDIMIGDSNIINEFTCVLCLNIVIKPLMIKCCDRLLCFCCIYKLLEKFQMCPMCKSFCYTLDEPPKVVLRILNGIKIKCPLSEIFKNDTSIDIKVKCEDYICHQSYLEHILNKCEIKKFITSIPRNDIQTLVMNKTNFNNKNDGNKEFDVKKLNLIPLNSDNMIFKYFYTQNKECNSNVKDSLLTELIVYDVLKCVYFCAKCNIVDLISTHNCENKFLFLKSKEQEVLQKFFDEKHESKNMTPIQSELHFHSLYYSNYRNSSTKFNNNTHTWSCDFCKKNQFVPIYYFSYNCITCDFDVCESCFSLTKLKKPKISIHNHSLETRKDGKAWVCDLCSVSYGSRVSFHCEECDFDVCLSCYYK